MYKTYERFVCILFPKVYEGVIEYIAIEYILLKITCLKSSINTQKQGMKPTQV